MKRIIITVLVLSAFSFALPVGPLYIYEGDYYYGSLTLPNPSPVYMYGGYVSGIVMLTGGEIYPECYIYSGTVDGIACGGGYLEITGGEITSPIKYYPEASMTLAGGLINSIEIETREWWNLNHIGIVCLSYSVYDLEIVPMGDATGLKSFTLEVTYAGGLTDEISVVYSDPIGGGQTYPEYLFDITIIPEPATLALLGLGGLALCRNSSRNKGLKR